MGIFKRRVKAFRSGLEEQIAGDLTQRGVSFEFEAMKIKYVQHQERTYTPDFILPNGIIVETKGYFTSSDRVKHLLIQKQLPHLDIRFVFKNATNKLYRMRATTYAQWCEKHGFKWAEKSIPDAWVKEKKRKTSRDDVKERGLSFGGHEGSRARING